MSKKNYRKEFSLLYRNRISEMHRNFREVYNPYDVLNIFEH